MQTQSVVRAILSLALVALVNSNATAVSECFVATADTYSFDNFGSDRNENFGDALTIDVSQQGDTSLDRRVAFLRFDLAAIPQNATIEQAELQLFMTAMDDAPSTNTTRVNGVASNWGEFSLTWNNQPNLLPTVLDERVLSSASAPGLEIWRVDSLVASWVAGTQANLGLAVYSIGLSSPAAHFHSREGSMVNPPRLCVDWNTNGIVTDLEITGIEVTQAIQDLNNSVRLVAGKRTFVRVHAQASTGSFRTFATLTADNGSESVTLEPVNPNAGHVTVQQNPDRAMLNHTFVFQLPSSHTNGTVDLTASLNPTASWRPSRYPQESITNNNMDQVTVSFEDAPRLGVIVYLADYEGRVQGQISTTDYSTNAQDGLELIDWIERAFPVSEIWYTLRRLDIGERVASLEGRFDASMVDEVIELVETKRAYDLSTLPPYVDRVGNIADVRHYAMVTEEGGFMRGRNPLGTLSGAGPTGDTTNRFSWDITGNYGDWYGAHEIGHSLFRRHAQAGCGSTDRDMTGAAPYPNGRISPELMGDEALYGFDIGTSYENAFAVPGADLAVYPPDWTDVMSYCENQWISDFTYHGILDQIQLFITPLSKSSGLAKGGTDRLLIIGTIDPLADTIRLQPLSVIPNAADTHPREPGPYAIVLRGSGNTELARYSFTPKVSEPGPGEEGAPDVDTERLLISELVPYAPGTNRVDIEGPEGLLESVIAGTAAPVVTLVNPNGGETISDDDVVVTWSASDSDGDDLRFHLQFSPDDGLTWEFVSANISGLSTTVSRDNLPSTDEGLFRVVATDGIHSASDESNAVFTLTTRLAQVEIASPGEGEVFSMGQTINLDANVYSPNIGTLEDASMLWVSSIDGLLGNGETLAVTELTPGNHTLSIGVNDGAGIVVESVMNVIIVDDPSLLPKLGADLEAGPPQLHFAPSRGIIQQTLRIDNQAGSNPINWAALALDSWVQLSSNQGTTPASVTVTVDTNALLPGTYTSSILLNSADTSSGFTSIEVFLTTYPQIGVEEVFFVDGFESSQ